ncbi:MAG: 1-acyl-sn-glycerol-3-phosphate acyltransferase [Hyphomonadaceae bacterium]|nr:1-acyl-sn-glycerol-3-phosphate acyltransferase [Hyphomonadaceae bacterium]
MTNDPASAELGANAVFLQGVAESDLHIVDELIQERCPSFTAHWTWPVMRPILYGMLGYTRARAMADHLVTLNGRQSFEYLEGELDMRTSTSGIESLPKSGRVIVAANHPTGLADGVAVWKVLREVREDIVVFANADAVRVNPRFTDVIIPVEWLTEKRSPAKTRETLRQAAEAFAAEKCVLIFPSGRLANMVDGKLTEKDWFTTVVGLAKKQNAPICPLNVKARNSRLYYFLSRLNGELRDITLFHELLNKTRARFDMTFGPVIPPEALEGRAQTVTDALRDYVSYELAGQPRLSFQTAPSD